MARPLSECAQGDCVELFFLESVVGYRFVVEWLGHCWSVLRDCVEWPPVDGVYRGWIFCLGVHAPWVPIALDGNGMAVAVLGDSEDAGMCFLVASVSSCESFSAMRLAGFGWVTFL